MLFKTVGDNQSVPDRIFIAEPFLAAVAYRLSQLGGPVLLLGVSEVTGSHPAEESHVLMVTAIGNSC